MITVDQRIAELKSKIGARKGKPGYKRNVAAMEAELAKHQTAKASAAVKPKPEPKESAPAKPLDTSGGDGVASAGN